MENHPIQNGNIPPVTAQCTANPTLIQQLQEKIFHSNPMLAMILLWMLYSALNSLIFIPLLGWIFDPSVPLYTATGYQRLVDSILCFATLTYHIAIVITLMVIYQTKGRKGIGTMRVIICSYMAIDFLACITSPYNGIAIFLHFLPGFIMLLLLLMVFTEARNFIYCGQQTFKKTVPTAVTILLLIVTLFTEWISGMVGGQALFIDFMILIFTQEFSLRSVIFMASPMPTWPIVIGTAGMVATLIIRYRRMIVKAQKSQAIPPVYPAAPQNRTQ